MCGGRGERRARLRHGERVHRGAKVALLTLEPTLVTRLKLHDVQVPITHGGGDQLVASAFVAVRGARENFVLVVRLALVFARVHVEHGGGGNLVRREPPFGAGLPGVRLHAQ